MYFKVRLWSLRNLFNQLFALASMTRQCSYPSFEQNWAALAALSPWTSLRSSAFVVDRDRGSAGWSYFILIYISENLSLSLSLKRDTERERNRRRIFFNRRSSAHFCRRWHSLQSLSITFESHYFRFWTPILTSTWSVKLNTSWTDHRYIYIYISLNVSMLLVTDHDCNDVFGCRMCLLNCIVFSLMNQLKRTINISTITTKSIYIYTITYDILPLRNDQLQSIFNENRSIFCSMFFQ